MEKRVIITIAKQKLAVVQDGNRLFRCNASTALKGPGNEMNSFCTPLGKHIIRAKIGADLPEGAVLKGRRWTKEICDAKVYKADPERDWILTRILWLSGCELGHNRLREVDTMRRYIYIHGAPDTIDLTKPESSGCIRVSNQDIIKLFNLLPVGTPVEIF